MSEDKRTFQGDIPLDGINIFDGIFRPGNQSTEMFFLFVCLFGFFLLSPTSLPLVF